MRNVVAIARAALLVFAAMGTGVAAAQQAGENGIKIGEGRLHPTFDLELHFDSAAGFFGLGATTVSPELLMHIRPGLRLEVPGEAWTLDAAGNVSYVYYTGLVAMGSQVASRLEASADFDAAFNRNGPFEVRVRDHFQRSDRTRSVALGVGTVSAYNQVQLSVPIRPGGGALEFTPKGAFTFELFSPVKPGSPPPPGCTPGDITCDPTRVDALNYNNLQLGLEGRWKFLPKTAVVLDSSFDIRGYFSPGPSNPPALLLKVSAGLAGLLTSRLTVVTKLGWGHDFATSGASTPVAQLELNYNFNETMWLKGGYLRTLEPVSAYGAHGDDRAWVEAQALLGGHLALHANVAFDYISFYPPPSIPPAPPPPGRSDTLLSLDMGPEYQFAPWLTGAFTYVLSWRASSETMASVNFTRHEGYARVTVTY